MRLLLDVHVATSIALALSDRGHDVVRAALAYSTWSDERLLALAVSEGRVVVSQDSDFSDLIYAFSAPPPPAIIYIRYEPGNRTGVEGRVLEVLDNPRLMGHMAVIKPANTRFRPLPDVDNDNA